MWIECSKRKPEKDGVYRVIRRGLRNRPHYEDWCRYETETGRWKNSRGAVIGTVEWWRED